MRLCKCAQVANVVFKDKYLSLHIHTLNKSSQRKCVGISVALSCPAAEVVSAFQVVSVVGITGE